MEQERCLYDSSDEDDEICPVCETRTLDIGNETIYDGHLNDTANIFFYCKRCAYRKYIGIQ